MPQMKIVWVVGLLWLGFGFWFVCLFVFESDCLTFPSIPLRLAQWVAYG